MVVPRFENKVTVPAAQSKRNPITSIRVAPSAFAGNVTIGFGELSPKAIKVVSTTGLSVPAAIVVYCNVTTLPAKLATVSAWPGAGSPLGITTVMS